jgi:hypothetical protein
VPACGRADVCNRTGVAEGEGCDRHIVTRRPR